MHPMPVRELDFDQRGPVAFDAGGCDDAEIQGLVERLGQSLSIVLIDGIGLCRAFAYPQGMQCHRPIAVIEHQSAGFDSARDTVESRSGSTGRGGSGSLRVGDIQEHTMMLTDQWRHA